MTAAYYDANYLFKLQCLEHGTAEVRAHAATVGIICCAAHGRAEFASAAFRKVREGAATPDDFRLALAQMHTDAATGNLQFIPQTEAILDRVEQVFTTAPATTYLRAADALYATSREVWPSGNLTCGSGPPSLPRAARKQYNAKDFLNYWCGQWFQPPCGIF